jgi:hypothetical protein
MVLSHPLLGFGQQGCQVFLGRRLVFLTRGALVDLELLGGIDRWILLLGIQGLLG